MDDVREKLKRFNKDILEDINGERKVMLEKANKEIDEYFERKENEYLNEAHENIQKALREIRRQNQVRRSKIIMDHKMKLLEKRNMILDKIYSETTKKLIAFTKTDEYKDYLVRKLERIKRVIGDDIDVTISFSDSNLKDYIESKTNVKVLIANKKRDLIGGVICYNSEKGIMVDESFTKILDEKKEAVLKICNLQVD